MEVRTCCFDLDGTLLNDEKQIDSSALSAIKEFRRWGGIIILASGREYKEIIPYASILELSDDDYIISNDGLYIYSGRGRLIRVSAYLSKSDALKVLKCVEKKRAVIYAKEKVIRIETPRSVLKGIVGGQKSLTSIVVSAFWLNRGIQIKKIQIREAPENIEGNYVVHPAEAENRWDVLAPETSKYHALLYLDGTGRIDVRHLLYFGDAGNDLEAFENLEMTVAMKNGTELVKNAAKFIAASNNEGGVGAFLLSYVL